MSDLSVHAQRRRFRVALAAGVVAVAVLAVLLSGPLPQAARQTLSAWAMIVAGLLATGSGVLAALRAEGSRRLSWSLLTTAGVVAVVGNGWAAVTGVSTNDLTDACVSLAMLLAIAAVLSFPAMKPRGAELAMMALDGVIVGSAMMTVASALVYSPVLDSTAGTLSARVTALTLPVLDVLLVTVSAVLVSRSRSDSAVLLLVGAGFTFYAVADLVFVFQQATHGQFCFGTPVDLGWVVGYLLLGLAARHPDAGSEKVEASEPVSSDIRYTVMVFSILVVAVGVWLVGGGEEGPTQTALWIVLVVAAGLRQILLALDNAGLRRGLERRVAEQTVDLRRLARQNEVLVTSVGDGIYGVDPEGRITFVNPSGAQALGFEPEALLGKRAHQEFHAPREDGTPHPWASCYVTQAIRHGVVSTSEEDAYVRPDGTWFPVEVTSSPLVDENRVTGAVVVFRDVTQRREVDRIKNEFLSMVSHELRTPLTSIRGFLGLLAGGATGPLSPATERMANVALESSERLSRLINDILDVERLESGTLPMRVSRHQVDDLLHASAAALQEMARAAGVRIEVGRADGVVLADSDRIAQTLTNLLSNAVKFTAPGGVVRLEAEQVQDHVVLRVRDSGRGIPADKLEKVFERFEQVDSSDARLEGGTGLGLSISRGIVERHGGRIWAESTLGEGTTMHVLLPAAAPAQAESTSAGADGPSAMSA